jgi:DNA (cytosine-5)-methyltransferase 1
MSKKAVTVTAIDLFCGAGGLTRGLIRAGLPVPLGVDLDTACEYPFESNNPGSKFILADVSRLKAKVLMGAWNGTDVRVLAGCAPCQAFSTYTQGRRWKRTDQWSLLRAFARLVEKTRPHIVTMENVPKLARHRVFRHFCESLIRLGFEIVWGVVDCRDFGIAQSRKRLVLIASRLGRPQMPRPTHLNPKNWKTVREIIGSLPRLKAGESHPKDRLHVASKLTAKNLRRLIASKPGGTWRDWPTKLIADCHKRKGGQSYPGVYGRMKWNEPGPTITGQCFGFGNGRFGHPSQNRGISLREAALLQTFPAKYSFAAPNDRIGMKPIGQLIGNAVPPLLGRAIGAAILSHVRQASK